MDIFYALVGLLLINIIYYSLIFAITIIKKDVSIANFAWGGGVALTSVYMYLLSPEKGVANTFITIFIVAWAARIFMYVYFRYTGKDPRFTTWHDWGMIKRILWVFGGQVLFMVIMVIPIVFIQVAGSTAFPSLMSAYVFKRSILIPFMSAFLFCTGVLMCITGFFIEWIADYQLFTFLKNPANKEKVLQTGLWYYSRHPNYFGEILEWTGIGLIALECWYSLCFLVAIDKGGNVLNGWNHFYNSELLIIMIICFFASITITCLFNFFSIPMLEKVFKNNSEYQEYKRKTSWLIPWFKKS